MKFEHTIIEGIPKSFKLKKVLDLLYQEDMSSNPYCIKYGFKVVKSQQLEDGEECIIAFRQDLSATGVTLLHSSKQNTLTFQVPRYASQADVLLFATLMNELLSKHPRARAFASIGKEIKRISGLEIDQMNRDRANELHRDLLTKREFVMRGLNHPFVLKVEHLVPYSSVEMKAYELMQIFTGIQWEVEEDDL